MENAKTHFEQIPVAEVMKKIADEGLKIEESRPTTAVAQNLEVPVAQQELSGHIPPKYEVANE